MADSALKFVEAPETDQLGNAAPGEQMAGAAPYEHVNTRGSWFLAVTAFVGCLYFVGINLGYLSFAGVLPELRLRYFTAGIFAVASLMRLISRFAFRTKPTPLGFAMYGLFVVVVAIQAIWYFPISNAGGSELYLSTIGDSVVASGIMAITGETLAILWMRSRILTVKVLVGGAVSVILATVVVGVAFGWSSTAEMRLMFSGVGEVSYNYLALGDSVAMLGLLFMGLLRRNSARIIVLIVCALALFLAYSRTSFFLFLLASPFVLFVGGKNAERIAIAAAMAMAMAAFLMVAQEAEALGPAMERMTVLLFQREVDESFQARQTLLAEGVQNLKENWMLGRFMDEWWRSGVGGNYMHNWLSFWQSYGFFPFAGSIALFAATGFALFKQLAQPRPPSGAAMAVFAYAMLAIITSRAYAWPFIWLAIGVAATTAYARSDESRIRSVLA